MNRRRKQKKKVDYLSVMRNKFTNLNPKKIDMSFVTLYWHRLPVFHRRALLVLVPVVIILLLLPANRVTPDKGHTKTPVPVSGQRIAIKVNTQGLSEQHSGRADDKAQESWKEYVVKSGDTLSQVFRNNNLPMSDINALVRIEGSDRPLSHIKAGQLVRFKLDASGRLDILQLEKGADGSVMFFRLSDGSFGRNK